MNKWPHNINMEITNFCNEKCYFCGNSSLTFPKGSMTVQSFKTICRKLLQRNPATNIEFCGYGEPFCNDNIYDMMEYLMLLNAKFSIVTNGLKTFKEERIKPLLAADQIRITLDAITDEVYKLSRPKGSATRVIENITQLLELRSRHGGAGPSIKVRMNVFRFNYHQMHDLINFCQKLGVDKVQIVKGYAPSDKSVDLEAKEFVEYNNNFIELSGMVESQQDLIEEKVDQQSYDKENDIFFNVAGCPWTTVRWDGTVCPCCYDENATVPLGNLLGSTATDLFSNESLSISEQFIVHDFYNRFVIKHKLIACDRCDLYWSALQKSPCISKMDYTLRRTLIKLFTFIRNSASLK